jgi:predicted protein tyrosine phosphatase
MGGVGMNKKENLLFVCTYNKMRSRTGEELFKSDPRFEVRSAGIDDDSPQQVNEEVLAWANCIVVMEVVHKRWIEMYFADDIREKRLIVLDIPDAFYFMEGDLIQVLMQRFEERYK